MDEFARRAVTRIRAAARNTPRLLVAIDGRSASGKTWLAVQLQDALDCNVVHMDHFFPQPEQRTEQRLQEPGGNVDHERFLQEVLLPLREGRECSYRPYDCHSQSFGDVIRIPCKKITIVEGSYSCHPSLTAYYDLRIFLSVDPEEQIRRIEQRNGAANAVRFRDRWIPLEERYFEAYGIMEQCELRYEPSKGGQDAQAAR